MGRSRIYLNHEGIEQELLGHEGWLDAEVSKPGGPPQWAEGSYNAHTVATGRYRPACECGWLGPIFDCNDPSSPWSPTELWPDDNIDPYLPDEIDDTLMAPWHQHTDAVIGVDEIAEAAYAVRVAEDRLGATIAVAIAVGTSWEVVARQLRVTAAEAEQRWSSYQPPPVEIPPGPSDEQWWDDLGASLSKAAFRDEDLAIADGLVSGQPKISRGRSRTGWEQTACQAMATSLDYHNFDVDEVVDADQLHDPEGSWRPPIGAIRINHNGTPVLLGVRIDDVGEIYAAIDDPADPRTD